jgi:hypothetical protein
MKQIYFLLLLFNCIQSVGQSTWEKYYSDYDGDLNDIRFADMDIKYDSVEGKYIFLGIGHDSWVSVYEVSDSGNFLFRNFYGSSLLSNMQELKFTMDNGAIISDYGIQGIYVVRTLYKIDSSYNIIWKYQYDHRASGGSGLFETRAKEFVLVWTGFVYGEDYPAYIKVDSSGNLIASKCYKHPGIVKLLKQTVNGNYLMGINSHRGEGFIICKTDTSGNVAWSKSYMRPKGVIADLIEKPNGNLIIAGSTDTTFQTPYSFMYISELDSMGNTIWTKSYGDSDIQLNKIYTSSTLDEWSIKIRPTRNGGFILLTSCRIQGGVADMVLLKTDSIGNLEWERRHGDPTIYELGVDFINTSDGGYFIVCGFNMDIFHTGYYLLKTDSIGSVGCNEYSDVIPVSNLLSTDSVVFVTDSAILINQYPALVHDTIGDPPDSLQTCNPDFISSNYFEGYELSVYPNPSTGFIHFVIKSSCEKDIFIYDMVGNEVYSKRNALDSDHDIDLSKNTKGIYLLTVTSQRERFTAKVVLY